jgi:S1-C subfamily serine protease
MMRVVRVANTPNVPAGSDRTEPAAPPVRWPHRPNPIDRATWRATWIVVCLATVLFAAPCPSAWASSFVETIARTQPKMVKIFGAGGIRGLEAYQSGFLISADGHVLTAWSYVLDTETTTVVLNDGRKFAGQIVGSDPRLEIAVLKIDATNLDYFDLNQAVPLEIGSRVLAFSNLFGVAVGDEPSSVLHGVVSVLTTLNARRGTFQTPYRGPVYILDAMANNAGAAGGALTSRGGRLAAILGKELRSSANNTWLNYAVSISELTDSVRDILAGKTLPGPSADEAKPAEPMTLRRLGLTLVPDILPSTPPFVDGTRLGLPAARAGLRPDDLIVLVGERRVQSCQDVVECLSYIDRVKPVKLTILREQELLDVQLQASP